MIKKIFCIILASLLVIMTGCGDRNKNESAPLQEKKAVPDTVTEEEAKEAESEPEPVSYSEEKNLIFASFEPLSLDYDYFIVDRDTFDRIDNEDCNVTDKGKAEYKFLDITTWPSEEKGYTTARFTYTVDYSSKIYMSGDAKAWGRSLCPEIYPFDYYTGMYIPTYEISAPANTTGTAEKSDVVETKLDFNGQSRILKGTQETGYTEWIDKHYADSTHSALEDNIQHVISLYITYPDEYDGLSFAINTDFTSEFDKDRLKEDYEGGKKNENIGKEILSVFENVPQEDILFCTMKTPESVNVKQASSEEEAQISSYLERNGLMEFNSAAEISEFSLPYEFCICGDDGKILNEGIATFEPGNGVYSISDISAEEQEDGKTKVNLSFSGNIDVDCHLHNYYGYYDGDYHGYATIPQIQVFNGNTGAAQAVKADVNKNDGKWGNWEDEVQVWIKYHQTFSESVEIEVNTDEIDDTVLLVGDRKTPDHVIFRLSELIAGK